MYDDVRSDPPHAPFIVLLLFAYYSGLYAPINLGRHLCLGVQKNVFFSQRPSIRCDTFLPSRSALNIPRLYFLFFKFSFGFHSPLFPLLQWTISLSHCSCACTVHSLSSTMTQGFRDPGLRASKSVAPVNQPGTEPPSIGVPQGLPVPPRRAVVPTVLDKDKNTPDSHVARDGRMIRLTGVHPFNAEAPPASLYSDGTLFLSSTSILLCL